MRAQSTDHKVSPKVQVLSAQPKAGRRCECPGTWGPREAVATGSATPQPAEWQRREAVGRKTWSEGKVSPFAPATLRRLQGAHPGPPGPASTSTATSPRWAAGRTWERPGSLAVGDSAAKLQLAKGQRQGVVRNSKGLARDQNSSLPWSTCCCVGEGAAVTCYAAAQCAAVGVGGSKVVHRLLQRPGSHRRSGPAPTSAGRARGAPWPTTGPPCH